MKRILIPYAILLLLCIFGFKTADNLLTIIVKTKSNSENIRTRFSVVKLDKNAKLVSISFTNTGDKTEVIRNIQIKLNETPEFNEKYSFLYGGYDMVKSPIRQC